MQMYCPTDNFSRTDTSFDRFDMNRIICLLVNSGNMIIGEPVFFAFAKSFDPTTTYNRNIQHLHILI